MVDDPAATRIYLYYLALAHHKVHENGDAMKAIDRLLADEPNNQQARTLKRDIDDEVTKDGAIGMAMVAGAVAVVGILAAVLIRKV